MFMATASQPLKRAKFIPKVKKIVIFLPAVWVKFGTGSLVNMMKSIWHDQIIVYGVATDSCTLSEGVWARDKYSRSRFGMICHLVSCQDPFLA